MRTCTNITAEQRNPVRAKTPQLFIQVGKVTVDWQPPVQRLGLPVITHNKTQPGRRGESVFCTHSPGTHPPPVV